MTNEAHSQISLESLRQAKEQYESDRLWQMFMDDNTRRIRATMDELAKEHDTKWSYTRSMWLLEARK